MDLEEKKKQLEIEKLEHEVRLQKKPLLFISTYAKIGSVVLQLITGAVAILFAYKNNWFDFQNEKLAVQKMSLEYDIKEFTQKKQNILDSITLYAYLNDSIGNLVKEEKKHNESLNYENEKLQKGISRTNEYIDIIDSLRECIAPKRGSINDLRHNIDGKIRDEQHNKVVGADVTVEYFLRDTIGNRTSIKLHGKSDSNGFFIVGSNEPYRKYCSPHLRITKKGYKDYYQEKIPISSFGGTSWSGDYYILKRK